MGRGHATRAARRHRVPDARVPCVDTPGVSSLPEADMEARVIYRACGALYALLAGMVLASHQPVTAVVLFCAALLASFIE